MIATRIPPPVYALATATLIWLVDHAFPALRVIPAPWTQLGWPVIVLGLRIDACAVLVFVWNNTTINPMRPQATRQLVVTGLNSLSRNPMYLSLVVSLCGWAWLLGLPAGWLLVWLFAQVLIIFQVRPEETVLREHFGERYLEYSRRVHCWFGRTPEA